MPNKIAFIRCDYVLVDDGFEPRVVSDHGVNMVCAISTYHPDDAIVMCRIDSTEIGAVRSNPDIDVLHTAPEIDEDESEDAEHWQAQLSGWLENSQSPDAQVVRDAFIDVRSS